MRKAWLLATLALAGAAATTGCDRSRKDLEAALATQQQMSAERDSLVSEMLTTTQLVDSINIELANARIGAPVTTTSDGATTLSPREQRAATLARVKDALTRLNESEAALEKAKQRIAALDKKDRGLIAQVERYQRSLASLKETTERQQAELQAIIDSQNVQIVTLRTDLDTARSVAERVSYERQALSDTLNTVYVISGKKDSLMKMGVVVNEGSKFLFFGGKTLQPARNLNPAAFTTYNRLSDTVIPLPKADKKYKIVTRQSPEFLASEVTKDGKVRGELKIAAPEQFWSPSRYLILVEQ